MTFLPHFFQSDRTKKFRPAYLVLPILLVALTACGTKAQESSETIDEAMDTGTYYAGVRVAGVDLEGRTAEQARADVQGAIESALSNMQITLTSEGWSQVLSQTDLTVSYDVEKPLQEAMAVGRTGDKKQMKDEQAQTKEEGKDFLVALQLDEDALRTTLTTLTEELNTDPVEPSAVYSPESAERFKFTEGSDGMKVDLDKLASDIKALFTQADKLTSSSVAVQTINTPPTQTLEEIKANTVRVSRVSTSFSGNASSDRVHNLKMGAEKINGVMIKPGREFSFDDVVGQRSEKNGWKKAATIVGGSMFEDDFGGGICQISTTLYNAVLNADLEVLDRRKHSIPSSYVDYGLDATVSWGSQDFVFRNNTDYPIFIFASCSTDDQKVYVSIYGRPLPDGKSIKLSSKIIEEKEPPEPERLDDSTASVGSVRVAIKERKGYTVEVYKSYIQDGKTVETVKLYTDTYRPVQGVVYVGVATTESSLLPDSDDDSDVDIPIEDDSPDDNDSNFEIF